VPLVYRFSVPHTEPTFFDRRLFNAQTMKVLHVDLPALWIYAGLLSVWLLTEFLMPNWSSNSSRSTKRLNINLAWPPCCCSAFCKDCCLYFEGLSLQSPIGGQWHRI